MEKSIKHEKTFVATEDEKIEIIVKRNPLTNEEYFLITDGRYSFTANEIIFPEFRFIV